MHISECRSPNFPGKADAPHHVDSQDLDIGTVVRSAEQHVRSNKVPGARKQLFCCVLCPRPWPVATLGKLLVCGWASISGPGVSGRQRAGRRWPVALPLPSHRRWWLCQTSEWCGIQSNVGRKQSGRTAGIEENSTLKWNRERFIVTSILQPRHYKGTPCVCRMFRPTKRFSRRGPTFSRVIIVSMNVLTLKTKHLLQGVVHLFRVWKSNRGNIRVQSICGEIYLERNRKDFLGKNAQFQALKNALIIQFQVSRGVIFFKLWQNWTEKML